MQWQMEICRSERQRVEGIPWGKRRLLYETRLSAIIGRYWFQEKRRALSTLSGSHRIPLWMTYSTLEFSFSHILPGTSLIKRLIGVERF